MDTTSLIFVSLVAILAIAAIAIALVATREIQTQYRHRHHRPRAQVTAFKMPLWGSILSAIVTVAAIQAMNRYTPTQPFQRDPAALPPFAIVGTIPGQDGEIRIRNSAPQEMRVDFRQNGKLIRTGKIPKCEQCQIYTDRPPQCPQYGYSESYPLPPGTYDVWVSWAGSSRPFAGRWIVQQGTAYDGCFYLSWSA
jgi:hypothetical protein